MTRISSLQAGVSVLRDPADLEKVSPYASVDKSWYLVSSVSPDGIEGRHLITWAPRRWTRGEVANLILASNEPHVQLDLSCVIGRRVRLFLAHGEVTGRITGFDVRPLAIALGSLLFEIPIPVGIILDGERWPMNEVSRVETVE